MEVFKNEQANDSFMKGESDMKTTWKKCLIVLFMLICVSSSTVSAAGNHEKATKRYEVSKYFSKNILAAGRAMNLKSTSSGSSDLFYSNGLSGGNRGGTSIHAERRYAANPGKWHVTIESDPRYSLYGVTKGTSITSARNKLNARGFLQYDTYKSSWSTGGSDSFRKGNAEIKLSYNKTGVLRITYSPYDRYRVLPENKFNAFKGKAYQFTNSKYRYGVFFDKKTNKVRFGVWNKKGTGRTLEEGDFTVSNGKNTYRVKGRRTGYYYKVTLVPGDKHVMFSLQCENKKYTRYNIQNIKNQYSGSLTKTWNPFGSNQKVTYQSIGGRGYTYKNSKYMFGIGFNKNGIGTYFGVWNRIGTSSSYEDFVFNVKEGTDTYTVKGLRSGSKYTITLTPHKDYVYVKLVCNSSSFKTFNVSGKFVYDKDAYFVNYA